MKLRSADLQREKYDFPEGLLRLVNWREVEPDPPGRWPTKTFNIRMSRPADSPEVMMLADRINIGTQTKAGGVTPVMTCCTMVMIILGAKSGI